MLAQPFKFIASAVLAVLTLANCSETSVRNSDVFGTWVNTLNKEVKIHFSVLGRFTFENLPIGVLKPSATNARLRISGSGEWSLNLSDARIDLTFEWIEELQDRPQEFLYISKIGPWTQLYFDQISKVEDSIGGRYVFEKPK